MDFIKQVVDVVLHLDRYLAQLVAMCGGWTYGVLFAIIFCETGLVVTPFLPGDSLLFATGALSALPSAGLNPLLLFLLLSAAAILGDTANYWIGKKIGPKVFHREDTRFFKRAHLERTHAFYERHGGKTIILARFIPIIRTFAPFVAGIGLMSYSRFLFYNVVGGVLWIGSFLSAGYFFGHLPMVKRNFSLVILVIIILSVMPAVIEYLRHRREAKLKCEIADAR